MSLLTSSLLSTNENNKMNWIGGKMATYRQGKIGGYALKFVLLGAGSLLLSACSTGIGSDEFGCSGIPSNGIKCISAKNAYEVTNYDGEYVPPHSMDNSSNKKERTRKVDREADAAEMVQEGRGGPATARDRVIDDYVTPNLPDRPIPIRTPAEVMRVWVAPWEDKSGDLITTGYVYTEIEERRWVIGDAAPTSSPSLTPLR